MAFRDHVHTQTQRVQIVTCDPSQRLIEGKLRDGVTVRIAVWEIPSGFRWPQQGEYWTIHYRNNFWHLGQPMEVGESNKPIEDLEPGDTKLGGGDGSTVYVDGFLKNTNNKDYVSLDPTTLDNGEAPVWQDGEWVSSAATGGVGGPPTGPAGGVLSGTYPNPGFAADMATQAELNTHKTSTDHDSRYYTEAEVDTALTGKSNTGHTHDDRYYTETEVDTALAGKASTSHTHVKANITDFAHTHTISDVTSLQTALDAKQPLDADLTAIAGLVSAADQMPYATGAATWAMTTLSSFARTLLDDGSATTMRGTIGAQAASPNLDDWAAISPPSGSVVGTTSIQTLTNKTLQNPVLTGNPTAPTPTAGDNDTSVATTQFVQTAIASSAGSRAFAFFMG